VFTEDNARASNFVNSLETVSSDGCYLCHFVLDIISVQFPFLDIDCERLRIKIILNLAVVLLILY